MVPTLVPILHPTQLMQGEGVWCHKSKSLGWLKKHGMTKDIIKWNNSEVNSTTQNHIMKFIIHTDQFAGHTIVGSSKEGGRGGVVVDTLVYTHIA